MKIRKGEKQDMLAVLELIRELATFEKEPQAVIITIDDLQRDGFCEVPLFETLVAEVDGTIVGMALFYRRYSTWKGPTIHLEDLIVTNDMRGSGIGFALYSAVIKKGYDEKVRRIEWNVLDWNAPAIEFYKKTGAKILPDWLVAQFDEKGIQEFIEKFGN